MADVLDSIVKGAPLGPDALLSPTPTPPTDPLSHAPSAPSMVYLNLLILEASLRAQFLELRARRRHHTFFLSLLTIWVAFFAYRLYLAPREDGRGVGGSIYWAVEGAQRVCFMGGIITAILVWAAGIWDRGIRWPRRWFAISNRGLRAFNCKLVLVRRPWWAEALSTVGFFLTYGFISHTASSSYRLVDASLLRETEKELQLSADTHPTLILPSDDDDDDGDDDDDDALAGHEEDLAPGGDYVKLLLLAKPFSPTFRENWELYRSEYWERENERRALLRAKVKANDRRLAKQLHGWLWWLPWRQMQPPRRTDGSSNNKPPLGRSHHHHHHHNHHHQHQHHHHHQQSHHNPQHHHHQHHRSHSNSEKGRIRRSSSNSVRRMSVGSSRSGTPTLEVDEGGLLVRRPSTGGGSDKRRKKLAPAVRPRRDSRSATPDTPSPLTRGANAAGGDASSSAEVARAPRRKPSKENRQLLVGK
ncbi:hypothetical protein L249_3800 [Ophiocordyceps polyrhachis-furcata BCC 54312]|uniref:Spo7-like protein n=1 Tax=Ophiocordyceps polyrhachis-furcata BCC 54312 TaxID=1330021 RepID=A0A367L5F0_9HYPO|nr:hypothetical protein L249_3800 [Ophiocordyceps polyrhachis-furcata BCC 54312]